MNSDQQAVSSDATNEPKRKTFSTRSLVTVAGIAAVSAMASSHAMAASAPLTLNDIPGTGDVKALNYALALEDLEADLYVQAVQRLTSGGTNALGTKITGLGLGKKELDVQYLKEFTLVEQEHRDFLRGALGSAAIKPFKYNFNIQNLNRKQVVDLVYTAEKTGVAAYLGATPLISRKYLRTAVAIQGTEARHTAVIAAVLNTLFSEGLSVAPPATQNNGRDMPMEPNDVLAAVSGFIVR